MFIKLHHTLNWLYLNVLQKALVAHKWQRWHLILCIHLTLDISSSVYKNFLLSFIEFDWRTDQHFQPFLMPCNSMLISKALIALLSVRLVMASAAFVFLFHISLSVSFHWSLFYSQSVDSFLSLPHSIFVCVSTNDNRHTHRALTGWFLFSEDHFRATENCAVNKNYL